MWIPLLVCSNVPFSPQQTTYERESKLEICLFCLKRSKNQEKLKPVALHHLNSSFQIAYWRQHGCSGSQTKTDTYQNLTCKAVTTFGFLDWLLFLHDPDCHRNRITQATDHLIGDLASSDDQYLNLHRMDKKVHSDLQPLMQCCTHRQVVWQPYAQYFATCRVMRVVTQVPSFLF